MTVQPEVIQPKASTETPQSASIAVIEDIFYLGYATSDEITIYKDEEKNLQITAKFRTLMPAEIRDVFEAVGQYNTMLGQLVTEQIETLARAIITINGMPLILNQRDREALAKELEATDPTPLNQARYIMTHKIKSTHVIDLLYEAYKDFTEKISEHFEEIKKKLKNPQSSD